MAPIRSESKVRARALQLLYAWDLQDQPDGANEPAVAGRLLHMAGPRFEEGERAEQLAQAVARRRESLDVEISETIEGWKYSRVGIVEKNIMRIALEELIRGEVPPRVAIDEALQLAHWFAGDKSHQLINGVLDTLARRHGRL
jgi:transcription antitermination protein NusB